MDFSENSSPTPRKPNIDKLENLNVYFRGEMGPMSRTLIFVMGLTICLSACGVGSREEPPPPPPPPAVKVTVSPGIANVNVNKSLQFSATVENSTNASVTWSLSSDPGNNPEIGTISETGLYTAPYIVPYIPVIKVTATSKADSSKSASAQVTILGTLTVTIAPRDILVAVGATRTFQVSVNNAASDDRVTWTLSGAEGMGPEYGILTEEGAYTAPEVAPTDPVVAITATSIEDPTISDSTTATIKPVSNTDIIWTWASGSDKIRQKGGYGIKGLTDPANIPGSRACAACWSDSSGNLWLFGGEGYDSDGNVGGLNDLWKYDPATREWIWVGGSDMVGQPSVWGTKGVADPLNAPGSRICPLFWTDPGGKLWLYGGMGLGSEGNGHCMGDLWSFNLTTSEWTWVSGNDTYQFASYGTKGVSNPSNIPGGRISGVTWIDASGKLWLFGGMGFTSVGGFYQLNDLWMYDPVASEWTWVSGTDQYEDAGEYGTKGVPSTSNVPGARHSATSWIDANGDLWLFGGYDYWEGYMLSFNDLWRFNPTTLEWTWISGSDWPNEPGNHGTQGVPDPRNVPSARSGSVSWTDSEGNFWLFGGEGYYGQEGYDPDALNDLWKFDLVTHEWTWMAGSESWDPRGIYGTMNVSDPRDFPGGRMYASSWYDSNGKFWLFGGGGPDTDNNWGLLNDLWNFSYVVPAPSRIRQRSTPSIGN
ncbi:MAG: Ig-like, group 2 [Candidatus Aminicenantes bacterium]|nr:Ig-like, group 2 [Candidatus Aminicenantes bacterium]